MAVAIFIVLAVAVAAVIAYPLLPGRAPAQLAPAVSDAEIAQAVASIRQVQLDGGSLCTSCGNPYRPEDRFCVRCGQALPGGPVAPATRACPSCGTAIREHDQFCAKCGHRLAAGEAV